MKSYQYRFDIREDSEYQRSPLVRAAFAIAQREHAPHMRGKLKDVPYLCHPIMVYDLLRGRGVQDAASLAAGLLHDIGEMSPRYADNIAQLQADLIEEMAKEGETGAMAQRAARDVARLVEEVTNPDRGARKETKQVMQQLRVKGMTQRAKVIKIADQTASLICHLMEPNAPRITRQHSLLFARKADGLVKEIARSVEPEDRAEIDSWRKLFDHVYDMNHALLQTKSPKAEANIRRTYRKQLDKVMRTVDTTPVVEEPVEPTVRSVRFKKAFPTGIDYEKYDGDVYGVPKFGGIYEVELTEQGEVVGFTVWASPHDTTRHYRNMMQQDLSDYLQLHGHDLEVETALRDVQLQNHPHPLQQGRYYRLSIPMDAEDFAALAERLDVIGKADAIEIERIATNLKRDFWMLETGGASRASVRELSRRGDAARR